MPHIPKTRRRRGPRSLEPFGRPFRVLPPPCVSPCDSLAVLLKKIDPNYAAVSRHMKQYEDTYVVVSAFLHQSTLRTCVSIPVNFEDWLVRSKNRHATSACVLHPHADTDADATSACLLHAADAESACLLHPHACCIRMLHCHVSNCLVLYYTYIYIHIHCMHTYVCMYTHTHTHSHTQTQIHT